jgi:hypothetical protein
MQEVDLAGLAREKRLNGLNCEMIEGNKLTRFTVESAHADDSEGPVIVILVSTRSYIQPDIKAEDEGMVFGGPVRWPIDMTEYQALDENGVIHIVKRQSAA